jgi:F0F1-type ATP synthase beta subunit
MQKIGKIKRIIGPVVDVEFVGEMPEVYNALIVKNGEKNLVLEVEQHLGGGLGAYCGYGYYRRSFSRDGSHDTGAPISVPVGKGTLGRIFNVLGEAIDDGKVVETSKLVLLFTAKHLSFVSQATKVEILETGIKVIDLICPVLKGRKGGTIRRCWCG